MKILLTCAAGMSTSLLVEKMKKAAEKREENIIINAKSIDKVEEIIEDYDVILLGPQIRYKLKEIKNLGNEYNIPVDVVDSIAYGRVDGEKVLRQALELQK